MRTSWRPGTLIYGLSEMAIDAGPGGNPVTLDGSGVSVAETPAQIHTPESNYLNVTSALRAG